MTKTITNLWLDLVALVVMLGLMVTGGVIYLLLPPGTGRSHLLFGLGRHDYGAIHTWLAVALLVVVATHLVLHWSFVCCAVAKQLGRERPGPRAILGWGIGALVITVLLPILGLVCAKSWVTGPGDPLREHPAMTPISPAFAALPTDTQLGAVVSDEAEETEETEVAQPETANKHAETCPKGAAINGRNTLAEAAAAAGMSVAALSAELKLAVPPSSDTKLGRLRRQAGVSIRRVRQIICSKRAP